MPKDHTLQPRQLCERLGEYEHRVPEAIVRKVELFKPRRRFGDGKELLRSSVETGSVYQKPFKLVDSWFSVSNSSADYKNQRSTKYKFNFLIFSHPLLPIN